MWLLGRYWIWKCVPRLHLTCLEVCLDIEWRIKSLLSHRFRNEFKLSVIAATASSFVLNSTVTMTHYWLRRYPTPQVTRRPGWCWSWGRIGCRALARWVYVNCYLRYFYIQTSQDFYILIKYSTELFCSLILFTLTEHWSKTVTGWL